MAAYKDEYNSKVFDQSWTIDKNIASQFAFTHYSRRPGYQDTTRVIIKAKINKKYIYYFNKNDNEQEVIIDERQINIDSIELIKERVLDYVHTLVQ